MLRKITLNCDCKDHWTKILNLLPRYKLKSYAFRIICTRITEPESIASSHVNNQQDELSTFRNVLRKRRLSHWNWKSDVDCAWYLKLLSWVLTLFQIVNSKEERRIPIRRQKPREFWLIVEQIRQNAVWYFCEYDDEDNPQCYFDFYLG